MHSWPEETQASLHRLRVGLRTVTKERGLTIAAASERFGRNSNYWGHVLAGRLEAKVTEVFDLLYHLQVPGELFFVVFFTPTIAPELGARSAFSATSPRGGARLAGRDRRVFGVGTSDHWDGEIWCDWVRARLLEEARKKGLKLRDVARALGLPLEAPSRALAGHSRLTFRLVFCLLAALRLPPHRFFGQATPLPRAKLPGGEDLGAALGRLTALAPIPTVDAESQTGRKGRRRRDSSACRPG